MLKTLGILTNLHLPPQILLEDQRLSESLSHHFNVQIIDVLDPRITDYGITHFLIRNTWAHVENLDALHDFDGRSIRNLRRLVNPLATFYNPLSSEMGSKLYLADWYDLGYSVIPTVRDVKELSRLKNPARYFIKPLQSWDGIGSKILTPDQLMKTDLNAVIIQPFMEFIAEVSFYFIDSELIYALETVAPDRRWDLKEFQPSGDEVNFAKKFWQYRNLPFGFLRVDALRLHDGSLWLTEVEGNGTYLSLECLSDRTYQTFVACLSNSLKKHLFD